jgi:sucrose-6-phosphate hydrolase SacC (GH32 family)
MLALLIVCGLTAQRQYDQRFRPQFHFSPLINWTNDPCGLVFAFAKYHLFFQFNPFANKWGHMSWGHATTADLVHWKQMPVAIPEGTDVAIFTGSSVFDKQNTSGLCATGTGGCIVSIFTGYSPKTASRSEKQTQNLAFSRDGVTWTKYSGNPVLDLGRSDSRDPKVFWHELTKQWILVMVLADEKKIRLFGSPDLKHWHQLSDFGPQGATGGVWECPDLYSLPVEGGSNQSKWVLKIGLNPGHPAGGSGEQYFIGNFDGTRFKNDAAPNAERWLDAGRDSYCELSFNNDAESGQHHEIGWMNNWQYAGEAPTSPWRGSMTIPKTIHLQQGANGSIDLLQQPVKALQSLRAQHFEYAGQSASELNRKLEAWPYRSQTFELQISAAVKPNASLDLAVLKGASDQTLVGYDAAKAQIYVDRSACAEAHFNQAFPSRTTTALHLAPGEPLRLQIFVDRSSVELFAQDGKVAITNLVYPKSDSTAIVLQAADGALGKIAVDIWKLNSIWR